MSDLEWFVKTMKKTFNVEVIEDEVGMEAFDFYHEDIDDLLIPVEHLTKLPNPLLLESLSFIDKKGYEWMVGIVKDDETRKKLYEVWIRDGEQIAYEIYV